MDSIAARLKIIRGNKSRRAFAELLEITESTLRNYEQGHSLPNSDLLSTICKKMQINSSWLLFNEGPMFTTDNVAVARATAGSLTAGAPIASFVATPSGSESACSRCAALEAEVRELRADLKKSQDEALTAYKLALEASRLKQGQTSDDIKHTAGLYKIRENTIKIGEKLQEAYSRIAELEEQLAEATSPTKRRNHS